MQVFSSKDKKSIIDFKFSEEIDLTENPIKNPYSFDVGTVNGKLPEISISPANAAATAWKEKSE